MTTITIDNQNYELETLSDEAKNQLTSLQFVDVDVDLHALLEARKKQPMFWWLFDVVVKKNRLILLR